MLNPVWLKTFVTLVDTGHFTKTAEKLFMTQPGVSQHVRKLEQACGHTLIRRENKSFELTEQGRQVYAYAGQLAKNERDLLDKLTFDDPFSGRYTISCSGSLALTLYPQLLDLQAQYPELIVQLKAAPNHQILNEIQQSIIDIGVVTHVPNPALFDVQELGHEQLCLVLPTTVDTEHSLPNSLTELGLIKHPDAEHYLSLYFAHSEESCLDGMSISEIPVTGYVNQISQILLPVARGFGFTILPKGAVDSFEDAKRINVYQPKKPVMELLYLVKKKNRVLPARFDTVQAELRKHF